MQEAWVKYVKTTVLGLLCLFVCISTACAQVNIQPQAPPGLGEKVEMFLGWIYWFAIVACVAGVIVGAVMIWAGRDNGRQLLIGALIALAILATLGQILGAIGF
jgi:hypothetical protein